MVTVSDLADGAYRIEARYGLAGVYSLDVALLAHPHPHPHPRSAGGRKGGGGKGGGGKGGGKGGGGGQGGGAQGRLPVVGSPFTVYAGMQLAEPHLARWLADVPRSLPALAADATGGRPWAGGSSLLAVASLGTWRHDREAILAQVFRAWKLSVGRAILERLVAGTVPRGSPRLITSGGAPLPTALPPPAAAPPVAAPAPLASSARGGVTARPWAKPAARQPHVAPTVAPCAPPAMASTPGMLMIRAARHGRGGAGRGQGRGAGAL
jgi:hypothetical protein